MEAKQMLILAIFSITCISMVALFQPTPPQKAAVDSFRGLKSGVSTFYDAVRILGKPTVSNSANKPHVHFDNDMYFYYKDLGLKLYGKTAKGFGMKALKYTKISKIVRMQ